MVGIHISGIDPTGLRKIPTYNELVDYIEEDPDTIRYPDRTAKLLRNSLELSQLDGYGMQEMERQQMEQMKMSKKRRLSDSYLYKQASPRLLIVPLILNIQIASQEHCQPRKINAQMRQTVARLVLIYVAQQVLR